MRLKQIESAASAEGWEVNALEVVWWVAERKSDKGREGGVEAERSRRKQQAWRAETKLKGSSVRDGDPRREEGWRRKERSLPSEDSQSYEAGGCKSEESQFRDSASFIHCPASPATPPNNSFFVFRRNKCLYSLFDLCEQIAIQIIALCAVHEAIRWVSPVPAPVR